MGHKRGKTEHTRYCNGYTFKHHTTWFIECVRCGLKLEYDSPLARLVGTEISNGFDGK